jgi:hypothetical protein
MADDLTSEALSEPYINSNASSNLSQPSSLLSDHLQVAWTGDFLSLKQFVNENLKLQGKWSQPRGDKKVFTTGTNSISWRKSRKDLQFKGTDAELLKHSVCSIMKDTGNIVNNMATNTEMPTCQNNRELTTDIACIKLDQVINERHIFDNTSRIKEIGNMLAKFEKQNEEIQQEIHNLNEISEPLRKYVQQTTEIQYANNPAQQQPQRRLNRKSECWNTTRPRAHQTATQTWLYSETP